MKLLKHVNLIVVSSVLMSFPLSATGPLYQDTDKFLNDRAGKMAAKLSSVGGKNLNAQIELINKKQRQLEESLQAMKAKRPSGVDENFAVVAVHSLMEEDFRKTLEFCAAATELKNEILINNSQIVRLQEKQLHAMELRSLYEYRDLISILARLADKLVDSPEWPSLEWRGISATRVLVFNKKVPLLSLIACVPCKGEISIIQFASPSDKNALKRRDPNAQIPEVWYDGVMPNPYAQQINVAIDDVYGAFYDLCPRAEKDIEGLNKELKEFQIALPDRVNHLVGKERRLMGKRNGLLTTYNQTTGIFTSNDKKMQLTLLGNEMIGLIKQFDAFFQMVPVKGEEAKHAIAYLKSDTADALSKLEPKIENIKKEKAILNGIVEQIDNFYQLLKRSGKVS